MRYALYKDPRTRRFALLPVPTRFVDGDTLPITATDRWFDTEEAAVAAVPDLLNRDDECDDDRRLDSLEELAKSGPVG